MAKYYVGGIPFDSNGALRHYGIKGQSWGKRRFQNEDGSYTAAGKQRYGIGDFMNSARNRLNSAYGAAREAWTGESYKKLADSERRSAANARAQASGANRTASQIVSTYGNHSQGMTNWNRLDASQQEAVNNRFVNALETGSRNRNLAEAYEKNAERLEKVYNERPRQQVQQAVNKGKEAVEKIQKNSSSFMSKISEMASSAINAGKSLLKKLFRR